MSIHGFQTNTPNVVQFWLLLRGSEKMLCVPDVNGDVCSPSQLLNGPNKDAQPVVSTALALGVLAKSFRGSIVWLRLMSSYSFTCWHSSSHGHGRESQPIPSDTAATRLNLGHRSYLLYSRHLTYLHLPHLSPHLTTSPRATKRSIVMK